MPQNNEILNKNLKEALDYALKETLGESTANMILQRIDERALANPELIAEFLETIFGSGARNLEKCVLRTVYSHFGRTLKEKDGYGFAEYIEDLSQQEPPSNMAKP